MKDIATRWAEFEGAAVLSRATMAQRREMRLAFYAGFHEALLALAELGGEDNPDIGVTRLAQLLAECRRFGADLSAGRAFDGG